MQRPQKKFGKQPSHKQFSSTTSWEPVEKWYKATVGEDGHYYHRQIILPGVLRLLGTEKNAPTALLDLACGPGVLAKQLPEKIAYTGVDISPSFIQQAKKLDPASNHRYLVSDITKPLDLEANAYSHAVIILALQNVEKPEQVFLNAQKHLKSGGRFVIVLNHPCFRVPRQSTWQVDEEKKIQYRRIDRYASSMSVPISTHPSKGQQSTTTWSFHHPLSAYAKWLHEAGFVIETMEEWCSDKVSTGAAAKMENRSRTEIPMFLTLVAQKR